MKLTHAALVLAGAIVAQPLIAKTINGTWGKYANRLDALAACEMAEAKGPKATVTYSGRDHEWQTRTCFRQTNHFELRQQEVRDYRGISDWNRAKYEVIQRFYF